MTYNVSWVKGNRASGGKTICPFWVVGDVENVITGMLESGSLPEAGFVREDFTVEPEGRTITLDPGGAMLLEDQVEFTVEGVKFRIRPHKLLWVTDQLQNAKKRTEGYFRISQGPFSMPWFLFIDEKVREGLLCTLMAMEFEPGVKEARDEAQARHDEVFKRGLLARPAKGGGYNVVKHVLDELPEGIDPEDVEEL